MDMLLTLMCSVNIIDGKIKSVHFRFYRTITFSTKRRQVVTQPEIKRKRIWYYTVTLNITEKEGQVQWYLLSNVNTHKQ